MNEAYVLLNVDYKYQKDIIEKAKLIPAVKAVKAVYGIYDILIILESENIQEIKSSIDIHIHELDGINNLTSLISVS